MAVIHITNENPKGRIDGTNKAYALSTIQLAGSLVVKVNGLTQLTSDVDEQQGAFELDSPPLPGDVVRCDFMGYEVTQIVCP